MPAYDGPVVVTGGSGLAGRAVVRALVETGMPVLSADRVAPPVPQSAYRLADLEDIGQCYGVLRGASAVVHLAGIPRPTYDTPERVFRNNVMAMFNVLEVALTLGIPRLVYASSVAVLGFPFNVAPLSPAYVPIDEAHPRLPQDPYALSKYVGEELADGFARRAPGALTVVSLRLPWIHTPESFRAEVAPFRHDEAWGAPNLWAYVDSRDVGQAALLALRAELPTGHHPVWISAADTFADAPSAELVRRHFRSAELRPALTGHGSLLDGSAAREVLGFTPAYSWRGYA